MRGTVRWPKALALLSAVAACEESPGAGGDADADADTDADEVCDEANFAIALVPGKLMILQDFSSSMADGGGTGADPNDVNFFFESDGDETVVPYDEGCADDSGWTWANDEHTMITFCDGACDQLRSGEVDGVTVEWGCPTVVIE